MTGNDKRVQELKLERRNLRRSLTLACDGYFKCKLHEDKEIAHEKVLDRSDRLFRVDSELKSLVETTEAEFDVEETYRDKVIAVKLDFRRGAQESSYVNIKLPKITINEVDLNPRTWVAFWGQFSRIHANPTIKEEDKFVYLLSSLQPNTKARDIAESYPPSKENYAKCIEHIKSRFGRDDLLVEVYFRDLLALVSNKQNVKLSTLFDRLGSYLRALETLGVTTKNYAAMLLNRAVLWMF